MLSGALQSCLLLLVNLRLSVVFGVFKHDVVESVSLTVHLLITWKATANLGETKVSPLATRKTLRCQVGPVVVDRVATSLVARVESTLEGTSSTVLHVDADAVQRL